MAGLRLLYIARDEDGKGVHFFKVDDHQAAWELLNGRTVHYGQYAIYVDQTIGKVACHLPGPGDPLALADSLGQLLDFIDSRVIKVTVDPQHPGAIMVRINPRSE